MNKKGFTLVELLGTILLISLLVVIITPTVEKAVKKGHKETNKQVVENIKISAQNYIADNKDKLPSSGSTTIYVSTLQSGGYIDKGIDLPKDQNKQEINCVEITKITGEKRSAYKYIPKHC